MASTENGCAQERLTVGVLLGVMNGEPFMVEQLESIAGQSHTNWKIRVSDDGSTDGSRDILRRYAERWGGDRLATRQGPSRGFAANFLSLACDPAVKADYYAFADQDDIWEPGKLTRALSWLETVPSGVPALYCGRTRLISEDGQDIGMSPPFIRKPKFANALVQSIAGGNTMVFNESARLLLRTAGPDVRIVSHDWWMYLVVSACGGSIYYDLVPFVRYRQHGNNLVGSNMGWKPRLDRLKNVLRGRFSEWNAIHLAALGTILPDFTPENAEILHRFAKARDSFAIDRCLGILSSGVYRQTASGNIGLAIASLLGKI